jgi:hypothetical protein
MRLGFRFGFGSQPRIRTTDGDQDYGDEKCDERIRCNRVSASQSGAPFHKTHRYTVKYTKTTT